MILTLCYNGVILKLEQAVSQLEITQLVEKSSAKEYNFRLKRYREETYQRFFNTVMSGLWKRMLSIQAVTNIPVVINGLVDSNEQIGIVDPTITKDLLSEWISSHEFKYTEKWYQLESLYYALKYRRSRAELATAAGKSYIIFLYCRYLLEFDKIPATKKILIITIRKMLVSQMIADFVDYEQNDKLLICDSIYSGGRRLAESNIVVGTYQSLSNMDKEYFDQFGAVIIDECHTTQITSIKDEIIPKINPVFCKYFYGLSGTQPLPGTIDDLHLEAHIGPVLFNVSAHQLQEEKSIADINIKIINILYNYEESRFFYFDPDASHKHVSTYLKCEHKFFHNHTKRNNLILGILSNFVGNQVILVDSVEYAKQLLELANTIEHKQAFLIYSNTPDAERERIKAEFRTDSTDKILVATYGTMSTGISINNILAIHFPDGGKSRIRMRQSCGRGLRLHPLKEYLTIFDYADLLKKPTEAYCKNNNIDPWPGPPINRLWNQSRARVKIYKEEQFPYTEVNYNI